MLLNEFRKRDIALGLFKYTDLSNEEVKISFDPMEIK